MDGNTPTSTEGVYLKPGGIFRFRGVPIHKVQLISTGANVNCSVQLGYGAPNEQDGSSVTGANAVSDTFKTIDVPAGTDPVASGEDTLTFESSDGTVTITGTGSNTINLQSSAVSDTFQTIDVPTGTDPVASGVDTLILTSGDGSVTINGTGSNTIDITAPNGDVVGPASATNNAIALFDGTTGKLIKENSGTPITIDASNDIFGINELFRVNIIGMQDTLSSTEGILTQPGKGPILHTFGVNNFFMGQDCGNFTLTGNGNVTIGVDCLNFITSGSSNVVVGAFAGIAVTTGVRNFIFGAGAANSLTTGSDTVGS
jgi:hypothetical protein